MESVAARRGANAGDQLLVLPTYRPTLTLSAGLTLQLSPETLLQLQAPDAQGVPGIKVMSGRLVALSAGKAGTRLRLTTGSASGVVTFSDADSTLGLEVHRALVLGTDPEQQESHTVADLYAANGHFGWTPAGGNSVPLTAPQRLTITATPADVAAIAAAAPTNVIPKWINSPEPLRSLDENVSEVLAGSLEGGKQLPQVLVEMAGERRVEFRSIGAQSLALMDDFEPLVTAFRDEGQRPMWAAEIASVRAALARGPAVAAKFREACEKQFGDDAGKEFYRMFWGYTKDQLQRDQAAKLVENLENNELAFRAVAIADLLEITGKPMGYVATDIPINRRQPVRRWQDESAHRQNRAARTCGASLIRNSEKPNLRFWEFKELRRAFSSKSSALMLHKRSFRFSCMSPKRSAAPTVLDQETCREIVATCACFNFRKASRSVTQLFDQILAPIGLRSTQLVILVTCEAWAPAGWPDSRELVMDRSTVTRNLRPLISQGYLQVTGKSGRAGKSVELTKAGQQALVEAAPYWQEAQGQLLSRLGQERWDRVMADLAMVVDATRAMA